ncbi:hypothetical protein L2D14_18400 [Thalassospiraceae bacterium LMO-JJ14]|nr:hypothetical protein L2D14_18400 [Thalassospiraceae bacterium LMO-JJ14]
MIDRVREFFGKHRWRAIISLATIATVSATIFIAPPNEVDPNDLKLAANVHFAFRFYPKYNYADCVFEARIRDKRDAKTQDKIRISHIFKQYILANEPETGAFGFSIGAGSAERIAKFEFWDKCDEAPDIIERGLQAAQRVARFEYSLVNDPKIQQASPDELPGVWLDSADYDPEYWALRKDVTNSCNPADWLKLARVELTKNELGFIHLSYLHASYASRLDTSNTEAQAFLSKMSDRVTEPNKILAEKIVPRAIEESSCGN